MSKQFKNVTRYSKAIHDNEHPYLVISQTILQDKNLDLLDKGIMAELLNHDESYIINVSYLQKISGIGEDRFYKKIKHLISLGYLNKKRIQSGVSWTIIESPLESSDNVINGGNTNCENTNCENTRSENTSCGNTNSGSTNSGNTNCGNTGILSNEEPIIDIPIIDEIKNEEPKNDFPIIDLPNIEELVLDGIVSKTPDLDLPEVDQTSNAQENELQRLLNKISSMQYEDYKHINRDEWSALQKFHWQVYRNSDAWSDRNKYDISKFTNGGIAFEVFEYKKHSKDAMKQSEMIKANFKLSFLCYVVTYFQKYFPKSEIFNNYQNFCKEANRLDLLNS